MNQLIKILGRTKSAYVNEDMLEELCRKNHLVSTDWKKSVKHMIKLGMEEGILSKSGARWKVNKKAINKFYSTPHSKRGACI